MATQISAKELAGRFDTDGRTVRKFLRSITPKDDQPGKGSRWVIEAKQVRSLAKQFKEWEAAKATETDEDEVELTETD